MPPVVVARKSPLHTCVHHSVEEQQCPHIQHPVRRLMWSEPVVALVPIHNHRRSCQGMLAWSLTL